MKTRNVFWQFLLVDDVVFLFLKSNFRFGWVQLRLDHRLANHTGEVKISANQISENNRERKMSVI